MMTLEELYDHIKRALPTLGLGFYNMSEVAVHWNNKGVVLSHGPIVVRIEIPRKNDGPH